MIVDLLGMYQSGQLVGTKGVLKVEILQQERSIKDILSAEFVGLFVACCEGDGDAHCVFDLGVMLIHHLEAWG